VSLGALLAWSPTPPGRHPRRLTVASHTIVCDRTIYASGRSPRDGGRSTWREGGYAAGAPEKQPPSRRPLLVPLAGYRVAVSNEGGPPWPSSSAPIVERLSTQRQRAVRTAEQIRERAKERWQVWPQSRTAPAVARQSTRGQSGVRTAERIRGLAKEGRSRATRRRSTPPVDARCRGARKALRRAVCAPPPLVGGAIGAVLAGRASPGRQRRA